MSWKYSTIGDVLSVIKNGINCEQNKIPVGERITRIETIAKKRFDFERVGYATLTESEKERSQLKVGDILFSHINSPIHVGKTALYEGEEDIYHGINLLLMRTNEDVNPNFFNHFLNHLFVTGYWEANCKKSVNQASVNQKDISKVLFNYPPLATQQKIVIKLDAIFAEIDKATAAAEANAKNAEALWQSMIDKVITDFNHLKSKASFSEVVEIKSKLVDPKEDKFQDFLHIGAGNMVSNNGELLDLKTAKEENLISGKFIFDENTVLYSKIRPYLKKVSQPSFVGLCSADVYPLVGIKNKVTKDFLFFLLLSTDFTNYAIAGSDRAGMPKVNREHLFAYQFNLPAIEAQNLLTTKIKNSYVYIKAINKAIKKKILELSLLKQSILRQAFNGELVKE